MTTIAWDGKTLAADSQAQQADVICSTSEVKIYQPKPGERWSIYGETVFAFGQSGDCGADVEIQKILSGNLTYESQFVPSFSFSALAVVSENRAYIICKDKGEEKAAISLQTEPYAVGSGGIIARVAMHCGKSAVYAVKTAIEMDIYSGGDVHIFTI
ncbi:hypothetical protein [Morganella morganii]|uniref:hypothetical protein n=1 Tax=Morganella morganii TaxID=582 RepID=UPI0023681A03|nr:hypothetical protein [Morganella morganii]